MRRITPHYLMVGETRTMAEDMLNAYTFTVVGSPPRLGILMRNIVPTP